MNGHLKVSLDWCVWEPSWAQRRWAVIVITWTAAVLYVESQLPGLLA